MAAAAGVHVVNRPSRRTRDAGEAWALRFPDLCPDTLVTADADRVRAFVGRHGAAVLKPVDGFSGIDVWLLRADDRNARSLVESATGGGTRHVLAQEYLPRSTPATSGCSCSTARSSAPSTASPAPDDFRIGPPSAAAEPDARDRAIVAALAPLLRRHGIALAGLDVIDGRLIEVNVTCPGGMHKTDALLGTDLSGTIMRRLLLHLLHRKAPRMNTLQIVCVALLGVLLFVLGANVTRHRAIRGGTGNQMPTDPADRMFIAIRAHGNAAEYVPTLCVLILVCGTLCDGWWVDALAVAAVVARFLHARRDADVRRRWPPTVRSATRAPWAPTSPASRWRSPPSSRDRDPMSAGPVVGIAGAATSSRGSAASSRCTASRVVRRPRSPPPAGARRAAGRPRLDLLDVLDALVLAGGDDIDPSLLRRPTLMAHRRVDVDRSRDEAEIALVRAARGPALPLLGVCRGLSCSPSPYGGTLVAPTSACHVLPGRPSRRASGRIRPRVAARSPRRT